MSLEVLLWISTTCQVVIVIMLSTIVNILYRIYKEV